MEDLGFASREEWYAREEEYKRSLAVILVHEDRRDLHKQMEPHPGGFWFDDHIDMAFSDLLQGEGKLDRFAAEAMWTQPEKEMFKALMTSASLRRPACPRMLK